MRKKLSKIGKSFLSAVLCLTMLLTTFCFFDIGSVISEAVVDVKKLVNTVEPTVKFYVPEAIYLNPVMESDAKTYNFQYFIDSDENGTLRKSATQTTGTVYFSCSAACKSITINWGDSVSPDVTENTHTNQIVKQTITGGTTSVRDGSVKVTATYVVGDKTYYAYAYTYMYYPELDLLTGTASSYIYEASGNEPKLAAFSFITGVHKVGNETTYGNTDERGVSNYYDQYNGKSEKKDYYAISPLIPGWAHVWQNGSLVPGSSGAIFKTANDNAYINDRDTIYGETSSSLPSGFLDRGNGGVYFHERERGSETNKTYGGINNSWGVLYVDTSRVTDYNQIPNLRGGFICHYYQRCGKHGELETFASDDSSITILNNVDFRNGDGHSYGMSDADRLSGAVTSTDKTYNMRATYKYRMDVLIGSSSTVTMNQDFGLKVYPVNKKSLREAYRAAIENGWQSTTASKHGWSSSAQSQWETAYGNFDAALASAGEVLGRPYATLSEVSTALSNLKTRVTACNNIVNANFQGGENPAVLPQVNFYVPETIYLNPSDNQTFQYFYGVETNGNPTKNLALSTASAGAKVYFAGKNCTPTKVKITVESSGDNETNWINTNNSRLNSISFGGSSFNGSDASANGKTYTSFPVNIQCTAGKLDAALASSSYRFLKWTAEYEVGGITYKTYAYTTVYAPYDKPAFAAARARTTCSVGSEAHSMAWIVGLTSCATGGGRSIVTDAFDPIRGKIKLPTTNTSDNDGNGVIWQDSNVYHVSSSTNDTGVLNNITTGDRHAMSYSQAPTGNIVVDSTRFTNLQYIPNLKTGYIVSAVKEGSSSCNERGLWLYASYFGYKPSWSGNGTYSNDDGDGGYANTRFNEKGTVLTSISADSKTKEDADKCGPRMVWNNKPWDYNVSDSTTLYFKGAVKFHIRGKKFSDSYNSCIVPLSVTVVNKSSLRSRYYDAVTLSKQQDWYARGFDEYQNSILTMAINLEHPARTTINSTVNTTRLVTKTGTTTAVHLRGGSSADYNGNVGSAIIGSNPESKGYTYGDRVYGYYNEIPGFTKSNYSVTYGSTTKTSGILQDSTYNNYYYIPNANTPTIEWKFWYTPNTYSINYDPNGGTYNGSTGLTSTSVLFQSKYTVGKIGSATPANPTRPGCTFMGWKCSADGIVYQPGANINWEFLENVTFTAQWEYNSINLRFNENHDSLAENMFDPIIEETLTHDSTASDSTACRFTLEKLDDGTLKANGKLAGAYTIGFVPMKFEAGKTYHFSNLVTGGSMTNGCLVMELAKEDTNNMNPRKFFNIESKSTATGTVEKPDITITQEMADQIAGIRFWIWHGYNEYMTFNNFTFKPRIELKSDSTTVATIGTEYNNIFADYMQYNTLIQELPTATRTGYTFDGWYTQANGGTKVNVGDRLLYSDWNLNNTSQTLYAHWTINKYKLMYENEFDFDNFQFVNSSLPKTSRGAEVTVNKKDNSFSFTSLANDDYTRTGQEGTPASTGYMNLIPGHTYEVSYDYTVSKADTINCFLFAYKTANDTSWVNGNQYISVSGSGSTSFQYTVPTGYYYGKLRFGTGSADVTLTVSNICVRDLTDPMNYKASDGINPSLNKTSDTVTFKATQSPLATITRQGYTFNGWYESENTSNGNGYGTQFTTSTAMPASDVPLYAQWKLNEYPIEINLNASEDGGNDPATIGSFQYSKPSIDNGGNIILNTNDSQQRVTTGSFNITVAYGTSFVLPIPSRDGWTFTGWTASATPAYASLTDNGNTSASAYRVGAGGVTLTAHWSRNSYPVKAYAYGDIYNSATFALGRGGTVQIASDAAGTSVSKNIAYRSTTTLKATASTGYAFVGWYTDSALTNLYSTSASITSESVLTDGRTYYAKFKVQSYTITVNPDNATTGTTISGWYSAAGTAASTQTIKTSTEIIMVYGSKVTMTAPEKTGYTFKGWSRTSGSTGTLNSTTGDSTYLCGVGAATLTAQWNINQYTITLRARANKFDASAYTENGLGGTVQIDSGAANNKSTNATYNYNTTYTIKAAAYAGYKFDGWYTPKDGNNFGTLVSTSTSYKTTLGASNITYYAKFSVQSYQITVNPNGATGGTNLSGWVEKAGEAAKTLNGVTTSKTITIVYGSTLKMTAPTRNGYIFAGWTKTVGTTGTLNSTTGDSTYLCGAGNATITAQWNERKYTIVFDPAGGSVTPTSDTFTINDSISLPTTPTRTGYTFSGWKVTTASGNWVKDKIYTGTSIPSGMFGNVTVTAQWTPNSITLHYDGKGNTGGTIPADSTFKYGASVTTAAAPTRAYTITYNANSGTVSPTSATATYTFDGWKSDANNNNYNAATSYTDSFGATEGTVTLTAQWTGGTVTLPNPTKAGYTFEGWYTNSALTNSAGKAGATYTATSNITLYAKWTPNTNTVYKVNVYVMNTSGGYPTTPTTHSYTGTTDTSVTIDQSRYYPDKSGQFSLDSDKSNVLTGTIVGDGSLVLVVYIERASHTVTYDSATNGGSTATQTRTVYYQGAVDFTLKAEKSDWTFIGWNTDKNATEKLDSRTMGTTDISLYAIFNCVPKATFYYFNGLTQKSVQVNAEKAVYAGSEAVSFKIPDAAAAACNVNGLSWTSKGFSTSKTYNENGTSSGAMTFKGTLSGVNVVSYYMSYSATVKIAHNANGGTLKGTNPTGTSTLNASSASTQSEVSLKTQTPALRDGYVFKGWDTNSSATDPTYSAEQSVSLKTNLTLYAIWFDAREAETKAGKLNKYVQEEIPVVKGVTVKKDGTYSELADGTIVTTYKADEYEAYKNAVDAYTTAKAEFTKNQTSANNSALLEAAKKLAEKIEYPTQNNLVNKYFNKFTVEYESGITNQPVKPGTYSLSEMNLNHYSATVLDDAFDAKASGEKCTSIFDQKSLNSAVKKMAEAFAKADTVKTAKPGFNVYESVDSVSKSEDASLKALAGATASNYVHTKKGSTYYCYVNTTNPVILVTIEDGIGGGRVCYPTTATALKNADGKEVTLSGSAKSGVETYSTDTITAKNFDTSYSKYTNVGIGGDINRYKQKQVIKLTPEFVGNSNGTVTYEFTATDDALKANVANQAKLSSDTNYSSTARYSLIDPKKPDTVDNRKYTTNENTIKIVVDYHVAEEIKDKNGNPTGEFQKLDVTGDQVQIDKYLNQYHLFRQSGGASNWELPKTGDTEYTVNDGTYKQTDRGSFTFTYELGATDIGNGKINTTDVNEIIKLFKDESNYSAAKKRSFVGAKYWTKESNGTRVQHEGSGLGYQVWGNNWSFNYYPKSESYTYVHLVDRWGNVVDKVFYVGKQDIHEVRVSTASADGAYTILEDGGSGIDTLSLNSSGFEILTDENSTLENNVFRTSGNTVRIQTGEANKAYTLTMTDNATNSSTATVKSDENGIITLSVEDTAYENGVYTFMLNSIEVNLYDGVNTDKHVLSVSGDEVDEGEAAQITVTTKGDVSKLRFTDESGNTSTVSSFVQNDDGTRTWTFAKARPAGEYTYKITVKVGYEWLDEGDTAALIFNERILDSGKVRSAEYDEETGLYKVTFEGRATKVQFVSEDGMTRTYTRYAEAVKSIKTYDADGNEVNDTARTLDHEVWYVEARLYSGQNYTVAGKFEAGWNRAEDSTSTVTGK